MEQEQLPPRSLTPPDHGERMETARALAQYQLGEPSWADMLVDAYLNPGSVPAEDLGR